MNARPPGKRIVISYVTFYLIFAAATARAIFTIQDTPQIWYALGLLSLYLLTLLAQPSLIARSPAYLHAANALQTGIALVLLLAVARLDYFSLLFIPPCAQSILHLRFKPALAWIGAILLLMSTALVVRFPPSESIGFIISYLAGILLIAGNAYLALQAEQAQSRSEALLADLQQANQRLQAYADQVQALAAAEERNRLARELHDSVTQIIFGLTLSAQAARILLDRDPSRVAAQLDHMQALAQDALTEMRALIQQLHPRPATEDGLPAALQRLAAGHLAKDGLTVDLHILADQRLPAKIEEGLFRVAQEALNNVVKHAHTASAAMTLTVEDGRRVVLCIEDCGSGFDAAAAQSLPGHLGLTSMAERIESLGGTLVIDAKPGMGTRLRAALDLAQEGNNA